MSEFLKAAAIIIGAGVAVYGLVKLTAKKCPICQNTNFKEISRKKNRQYLKNKEKTYRQTQEIKLNDEGKKV